MKWRNIPLDVSRYPMKAEFPMTPKGITIHETDNNASAFNEISYMQRNDNKVSFHFAVDEKEVIQGLPLDRNAWHAGDGREGKGNRTTIAIEICRNYRTDDLTNYYKARAKAEELVGYLMFKYNFTDKDIYTHNTWIGKNCPRVILKENYLPTFKANAVKHKASFEGPAKEGKAVIQTGAKYRSKDKKYDGKDVPSRYIGIPLEYRLEHNGDKNWVFFPSIVSYVHKDQVRIGGKPVTPPKEEPKQDKDVLKYKKGDKVTFNGNVFNDSAGNGKGASFSKKSATVDFNVFEVTKGKTKTSSHPYHVGGLGWIKESQIIEDTATKAPKGKAVILANAVYRSKSKQFDGVAVPKSRIGVPMEYTLNHAGDKNWVYFPTIQSYVHKNQVRIG